MALVRLLLDEDVWPGLGAALQTAGYDAVSVHEIGRRGFSDEAQMAWAVTEGRAIFTHNIRDFVPLVQQYAEQGVFHPGVIVAVKFEKGLLIERTLTLLQRVDATQMENTLRFV
ncbi:MAG: DUF5615 family PIN-like protein [Anaerolineales bacterium]|nr:DUF5615 family PIN-like protein [Anaerolineales bacterium]